MKTRLQFGLIHKRHSHSVRLCTHAFIKYQRLIHSIKISACCVILMTPLTQHAWNAVSQQNVIITNSTFALAAVTCRNVCREKKKAAEDRSVAAVGHFFLWVRFWKVLSHNGCFKKNRTKTPKNGWFGTFLPPTHFLTTVYFYKHSGFCVELPETWKWRAVRSSHVSSQCAPLPRDDISPATAVKPIIKW